MSYDEWKAREPEPYSNPRQRTEPWVKCHQCGAVNVPFITNPFLRGVLCHACYRPKRQQVMVALTKKRGAA